MCVELYKQNREPTNEMEPWVVYLPFWIVWINKASKVLIPRVPKWKAQLSVTVESAITSTEKVKQ